MVHKSQFKKPNQKELQRLAGYMTMLHQAACYFKDHFVGQKVVYSTSQNTVAIYFSETNYMHLCGLYYAKGTKKFFSDCLGKQVDLTALMVKKDGTTMQKLQVLGSISDLTSPYVRLTGSGRYLFLEFDYALRTKKQILAVTLKDTTGKIVPQSLLNLKSQKCFPTGEDVTQIYSVDLKTQIRRKIL